MVMTRMLLSSLCSTRGPQGEAPIGANKLQHDVDSSKLPLEGGSVEAVLQALLAESQRWPWQIGLVSN